MPATGRSYYPNVPGALEQALAGSVADGTSVWGPLMMMSARHERQQAIDDVNETQAQQFMLGLKASLQQETVKALGSAYGSGLRGGHDPGAIMAGLHNDFGAQIPQDAINRAQALDTASQVANVVKSAGEGSKAGAEGGQTPILSGLYGQLGIPTATNTPLGIQEHQIAAGATEYAADRGLQGKVYSTDHKQLSAGKGGQPKLKLSGVSPLSGNYEADNIPFSRENLAKYAGEDVAKKVFTDPNSAASDFTGQSELTPTGDSIQRDPELPHILDHVTNEAKAAGATLVGAQGNPRYGKNKKGQKVVVVDVTMPDGSHGTMETPTLRQ